MNVYFPAPAAKPTSFFFACKAGLGAYRKINPIADEELLARTGCQAH
jgi:hypothetical protein